MPLEGPHQFKCVRLFIRVSKCTQDARQMQIAQLMYRGSTTCILCAPMEYFSGDNGQMCKNRLDSLSAFEMGIFYTANKHIYLSLIIYSGNSYRAH